MSSQIHGIGEYVKRLEKIAEECGEKPKNEEVQKDEFLRHKSRCYELLEEVRDTIRERTVLIKRRGNCLETIQKGHQIRQQLTELRGTLPKLQELHKRAQSRWKNKLSKDELQERYQVIRLLKRQVDEANELFVSGNANVGEVPGALAGIDLGPSAAMLGSRSVSSEDRTRLLTSEEQGAIDKIRQRDGELDKQVDEIGKVVTRATEIARHIGATAERQRLKAEGIGSDVEKADTDLKDLNKKVADVISYEKNTNFCCQMALVIALLCCVGYILQQLT
mmetsp:Transcript_70246/g.195534  ORF Transcript_70246/g.195534 Transcript_70246/m.195534 type:complete len:278 (-) Transcript_70246:69-902(-)